MVRKISGASARSWPMLKNKGSPPAMPSANFGATVARTNEKEEETQDRREHSTPDEIKGISTTQGAWRPLLIVAIFTGLRASELRGLRWNDVNFKANELHVRNGLTD